MLARFGDTEFTVLAVLKDALGIREVVLAHPKTQNLQLWDTDELVLLDVDGTSLLKKEAELKKAYTDDIQGVGRVWVYELGLDFL